MTEATDPHFDSRSSRPATTDEAARQVARPRRDLWPERGVEFVLGLDGAPENLGDRALFFHAAPALVASMAGLVPLLWAGRGARTR